MAEKKEETWKKVSKIISGAKRRYNDMKTTQHRKEKPTDNQWSRIVIALIKEMRSSSLHFRFVKFSNFFSQNGFWNVKDGKQFSWFLHIFDAWKIWKVFFPNTLEIALVFVEKSEEIPVEFLDCRPGERTWTWMDYVKRQEASCRSDPRIE